MKLHPQDTRLSGFADVKSFDHDVRLKFEVVEGDVEMFLVGREAVYFSRVNQSQSLIYAETDLSAVLAVDLRTTEQNKVFQNKLSVFQLNLVFKDGTEVVDHASLGRLGDTSQRFVVKTFVGELPQSFFRSEITVAKLDVGCYGNASPPLAALAMTHDDVIWVLKGREGVVSHGSAVLETVQISYIIMQV